MASSFSRLAGSNLRRHALSRGFRTTANNNVASVFTMPAMSPTMTEGAITQWKVKEGDKFIQGDVLLEIETDKAQMDVEAQEDGVMAKIIVETGAKAVQVGTRIAVLAEPDDDLSTLEIPVEESPPKKATASEDSPKKMEKSDDPKPPVTESSASSTPETAHTIKPQHPSPSVMHLLRVHSIDSANKIVGTGPKGRLLKGDILAYLGKIDKDAPKSVETSFKKLSKLDLSNIKIAPPEPKEAPAPAAAAAKKGAQEPPKEAEVVLSVSFAEVVKVQERMQATIGVFPPLSTFISKATAQANAALPPVKTAPTADELFDDLLGLPPTPRSASAGSFSPIIAPQQAKASVVEQHDIIDILSGLATPAKTPKSTVPSDRIMATGQNVLTLRVPAEEEERARVFLGRIKGLLEQPSQLVL